MTSRVQVGGYTGGNHVMRGNNGNYNGGAVNNYHGGPMMAPMQQEDSSGGALVALGVLKIILGLAMMAVTIAGIINYWGGSYFSFSGIGLGLWVLVCGAIHISANNSMDIGRMVASLVLSISVCFGVWWPISEYVTYIIEGHIYYLEDLLWGLYAGLLAMSLLTFILAIVSSVIGGRMIHPRVVAAIQGPPMMPQAMAPNGYPQSFKY